MTQTPNVRDELPKAYEPKLVEQKWYQFWMEEGYFKPTIDPSKKPFVIIMPPPNITGELHLGHALTATLEDIMARWHRMQGDPTLWLPGVDHAGIAAQVVVERMLAKERKTRFDLGREEFEKRVWAWARQVRHAVTQQHQRLGVSCDWSRERFTLDEGPSRAVRTAFVTLYKKGLIYRGERIINWCPRCGTALSDLEVDHKDITGHLWYLKYPYADNPNELVIVATTRPETMLGDTAVAVNPDDSRYKGKIGKKLMLPLMNREIPIVGDEAVDPQFGTGAVKVTPAHDPVDFDIAQRHNLPSINLLNPDATMNENAGTYKGMDRLVCREKVVEDLEKLGLLVKIEPYGHSVGHCQRCTTTVEPIVSKQWFVKMPPLAAPAIKAVNDGRIRIVPDHFTKVYLNWMENIRDWCISRQLWWGHRIPVWYCAACNELTVSVETPKACAHCGSTNIHQDPDVLDTWFSSALWPHSTLGWPDKTGDFAYFYPTTVMETGYDILFFWVARMIIMGIEDTGDIPFKYVYLHGLIRDENGEKMSKVKGNVLNPITLLEKYGTDALRFALSTGTAPGNDIKLAPARLEAARNFANKLWNAARFVATTLPEGRELDLKIQPNNLPVEDRWIMSRLNHTVENVNSLMRDFQFGEAQRVLHDFIWGEYCDWYIELAKIRMRQDDSRPSPIPVLVHVLETSLRLLHPYMPFITEELWQNLKQHTGAELGDSIMIAPYPVADAATYNESAEETMGTVTEIIRAIRNVRAQYRVEQNRWVSAEIHTEKLDASIKPYTEAIENLARARPLTFTSRRPETGAGNTVVLVLQGAEVSIPMESMVDTGAEEARLSKEIEQLDGEVTRLKTRLEDAAFLTRAPPAIVAKDKQRLNELSDKLARLRQQLSRLKEG